MSATKTALAVIPEGAAQRGLSQAQWGTLSQSLFPGANPLSVLMVVDYCQARRLDPMKKPCHIVPMEVKDARTGSYEWRDVVMPGIYEHRTTAQRTDEYLGHSKAEYGPEIDVFGVKAPEWCSMTTYRWNPLAGMRAEFPVQVFFREVVALAKDRKSGDMRVNGRWTKAPIQMLTKCTEAAGLREAFPDEIGGEQTAEEMEGQRAADHVIQAEVVTPKPEGYDDWWLDMTACAENGEAALRDAWTKSSPENRRYLTTTDPDAWEALKAKAATPVEEPPL